jgi:PKD repeat protein
MGPIRGKKSATWPPVRFWLVAALLVVPAVGVAGPASLRIWPVLQSGAPTAPPINPHGPDPSLVRGNSNANELGSLYSAPNEAPAARADLASGPAGSLRGSAGGAPGWTNVTNGTAPSPRFGAAMAFDPSEGYTVLFGGVTGPYGTNSGIYAKNLNDTWTLENGIWKNITSMAGVAPPAREFASLTYDSLAGYLLLAGGEAAGYGSIGNCDSICRDTWEFSNGTWHNLNATVEAQYGFSAVYDSTDGYVLGLSWDLGESSAGTGGASSEFVGGRWVQLGYNSTTNTTAPSPEYWYSSLVNDPSAHEVLLMGGSGASGVSGSWVWSFSNGTWTNLTSSLAHLPPANPYPSGVYDPADAGVLFLATNSSASSSGSLSTWFFNGSWSNVTQQSPLVPPTVEAASLAFDNGSDSDLLFGGSPLDGSSPGTNFTWEWGTSPSLLGLNLTASPSPADANSSVSFRAAWLGGVGPFQLNWTFGDGARSNSVSPSHSFSQPGLYTVNLSVSDSLSRNLTGSVTLRILAPISAAAFGSPNPTDVGLPTKFESSLSGGTTDRNFTWTYGDGTNDSSSDSNSTHAYLTSGSPLVTFRATDSGGGLQVVSFVEQVNPALGTPVISASSTSVELGFPVNFTVNESGGTPAYAYAWSFGDGGVGGNLSSITHVFTTNGPFLVMVTVSDRAGATASASLAVAVTLSASIQSNGSIGAAPLVLGFTGLAFGGTPGYSYVWNFGDGQQSSGADSTHSYPTPGSYTVSLQVRDDAGRTAMATDSVEVFSGGGALRLLLAPSDSQISIGEGITISALPAGGAGVYSLQWGRTLSGCQISGALQLICAPDVAGDYSVSATLRDGKGNAVSSSTTFVVGAVGRQGGGGVGLPALLPLGALILGAVLIAAIAFTAVRIRSSTKSKEETDRPDDARYLAYHSAGEGAPPPSADSGGPDPLEDVF